MAEPNIAPTSKRDNLPQPVKVRSDDGSVRLLLTSVGVSLRILGHEWNFIVRSGSLEVAGAYAAPNCGHDGWAKAPAECRGCRELCEPGRFDLLSGKSS